ncbi:DNA methyltransferase 1-associated protein 1-like isoform X1 [Pomacea canaliculata]|uniref:DNA methyltransferase 1-associated protein 1-like isoform X1 n=1 Tax=Pomacea canaliculata TaxID=400727 RepID=UPI000D73FECB|nr:DNA methyltransferase 1-associated protein 1-like isoform X1 [Pomacea canaliculata]
MTSSDVRDILELDSGTTHEFVTKESLMNDGKKKKVKKPEHVTFKRPEGMHRELWGLLWTDNARDPPPIFPSDSNQGYKQMKAKIGSSRVRPWKWMPFTNPARKDGAVFYHWRKVADEGKDYPFARFNKVVDIPAYSDLEYQQHLHDEGWTRQETDHLFDLCKRFDVRFIVVHDRWDRQRFRQRSVEDLKERYYNVCNTLTKVRAPQGTEPKIKAFDAEHERRRKTQLTKLFERTQEQCEEEDYLIGELKKIELRKKEREKKTQDLQKLITAADSNMDPRKPERKATKKKFPPQMKFRDGGATPEPGGIKFPDFKQSGVSLRSQRMKLPASIGQKKMKAIEQVLEELGIEFNPMPTEEMVQHFNELRQDIVLLYELKLALASCEYELQMLRLRYDTLNPAKSSSTAASTPLLTPTTEQVGLGSISTPQVPSLTLSLSTPATPAFDDESLLSAPDSPGIIPNLGTIGDEIIEDSSLSGRRRNSDIDVVGTPQRKRKGNMEQMNLIKKMKQQK